MKQIIKNKYLKEFRFSTLQEASFFCKNQKAKRSVFLEDSLGDNYYCYVCYHSLTQEKLFVLFFGSDENENNLNFSFWNHLFILDTGKRIYLMDEFLNIKIWFPIITSLIGFYIINQDRLLLLEEAYMRIVDSQGKVIENESFNLIENFRIENNVLFIQTSDSDKIIKLI